MKTRHIPRSILAKFIPIAVLILATMSCGAPEGFNPGAEGVVTLSLSGAVGAAARSALPPPEILAQITYTIEMQGAATRKAGPTRPGEQTISISAPAGQYTVKVTAWLNGAVYADGSEPAVIKAGETTSIIVRLHIASGGTMQWTTVANSTFGTTGINRIAYGGGKFVAVGQEGKMATSPDGTTWTAVTDSTFGTAVILSIAYVQLDANTGMFVAGSEGGEMATSPDGTTWTAVTNSNFGSYPINTIAYGNGKFVAGSIYSKMVYSSDGITWTAVTNSPFTANQYFSAIAYGGGKFVAVGGSIDPVDSNGKMAYSSDGETWIAVMDSTFDNDIRNIAYGNGKFVAVGSGGKMAYSPDGESWTAVTESPFNSSQYINAIAYGNGKFVAGGTSGKTATSTDGINWTLTDSKFGPEIIGSIAYGNGKFVAVGRDGKIAYSN